MTQKTRIVLAVLALVAFGVVLGFCTRREAPTEMPTELRIEKDGLRYTYHVPTGHEALFDLSADPKMLKNLAAERPDDARRLRAQLEESVRRTAGVKSLEDLRAAQREVIDRLRRLGYF
jgi:hypothetical protein